MTLWTCTAGHLQERIVIVPVFYVAGDLVHEPCLFESQLIPDRQCTSRILQEVMEPATAAAYRLGGLAAAEDVWWPHGRSRWLHGPKRSATSSPGPRR